jgi:autotransporter-associated beta strand protein
VKTYNRGLEHGLWLCLLIILAAPAALRAQNWIWVARNTDDRWSTAVNWHNSTAPANNGTANIIFTDVLVDTNSIVDLPWSINSLRFDNSLTPSYSLSGSPLTIGAGGIVQRSPFGQDVRNDVTLSADQTWEARLDVFGNIQTEGHQLTISNPDVALLPDVNFWGAIYGGGGITITAGAQVSFFNAGGSNTYTGATTVNNGILRLMKHDGSPLNSFGSAIAGPLVINQSGQVIFGANYQISITQPVTINGGFLDMRDFVNFFGAPVTMTGGWIKGDAGTFNLFADLNILPSTSPSRFDAHVNLDTVRTFNVATGSRLEFGSKPISGGGIIKAGGGFLQLGVANTFSSGLTINDGTVQFGDDLSAGSGPITINGGVIAGGSTSGAINLENDATIFSSFGVDLSSVLNLNAVTTLSASPTITVNGDSSLTLSFLRQDSVSRSLVKNGAGTLRLHDSSYTGTTTVNEGTLILSKNLTHPSASTVPGNLIVGDGIGLDSVLYEAGGDQIFDSAQVTINPSGLFFLDVYNERVDSLRMTGGRVLGSGTLTVGTSVAYAGGTSTATISSNLQAGNPLLDINVAKSGQPVGLVIDKTLTGQTIRVAGTGTLQLSGTTANNITTEFDVNQGTVLLNKSPGVAAISAPLLYVGDAAGGANADVVRLAANEQIANSSFVAVRNSGLLDLNGFNDTITGLQFQNGGNITTGSGTLTVAPLGIERTYSGPGTTAIISGNLNLAGDQRIFEIADDPALAIDFAVDGAISNGALFKVGSGTMRIGGDVANTYGGDTMVYDGALFLQKKEISNMSVRGI